MAITTQTINKFETQTIIDENGIQEQLVIDLENNITYSLKLVITTDTPDGLNPVPTITGEFILTPKTQ